MKIGFLTSHRGQKQFEKEHRKIIEVLEKKGHEVLHSMDMSIEKLLSISYMEREKVFIQFYESLEECELIFAECSLQSTQVGFGLAHLRAKGKPIVLLSLKGADPTLTPTKEEVYSNVQNMMVYEYTYETIRTVIDNAFTYMEPHLDKRFTIIFPAHLLAKVEEITKRKKIPKSVYIRQLIEKTLKEDAS